VTERLFSFLEPEAFDDPANFQCICSNYDYTRLHTLFSSGQGLDSWLEGSNFEPNWMIGLIQNLFQGEPWVRWFRQREGLSALLQSISAFFVEFTIIELIIALMGWRCFHTHSFQACFKSILLRRLWLGWCRLGSQTCNSGSIVQWVMSLFHWVGGSAGSRWSASIEGSASIGESASSRWFAGSHYGI
jgi:hypothetical protein